jgi:predicted DNA-binding helix-hairpin-helix protein
MKKYFVQTIIEKKNKQNLECIELNHDFYSLNYSLRDINKHLENEEKTSLEIIKKIPGHRDNWNEHYWVITSKEWKSLDGSDSSIIGRKIIYGEYFIKRSFFNLFKPINRNNWLVSVGLIEIKIYETIMYDNFGFGIGNGREQKIWDPNDKIICSFLIHKDNYEKLNLGWSENFIYK